MDNDKNNQGAAPQAGSTAQNMRFYDVFRHVPEEAKKAITDGRLRGKTDINPMWRIKALTEAFGPVGFGWRVEITRMWLEQGNADTTSAFVDINLYVKDPETGQWSEPIPGTGGNTYKRKEDSGKTYIDDDCYKKALTDAMSIACKWLGIGADVYYASDPTSKYATGSKQQSQQPTVRNRPATAGQAPAATQKPVLNPSSPFWLQSVTIAMNTTDDIPSIRQRIEKKYSISDNDFLALMKAAGKVSQEATTF